MKLPRLSVWLASSLSLLLVCPLTAQDDGWRTIEFETTEVTTPDVAITPDGEWLIFTLLGHLFRLPVEGGEAAQLTFGPYYDTDPAFSPDGRRVAFVSDRDGSDGNVFVLELATGQVAQLTHEPWAARPAWSPDGEAIVYLLLLRDRLGAEPIPPWSVPETVPALIRRVALSGGEPETLAAPPRLFRSVFYFPDGRVAWAVVEMEVEPQTGAPRFTTRIEALRADGTVNTLSTLPGYAAPAVPSPTNEGVYCRRFFPGFPWYTRPMEELLYVPVSGEGATLVDSLPRPRGWVPQFAVEPDNRHLYLGEGGRLWRIRLSDGVREPIPFTARVRLEIRDAVRAPTWSPTGLGEAMPPRTVQHPRLSPDGRRLVFGAAGFLWEQRLDGGPAQRLFEGSGWAREPAFSPDGSQLAFVHKERGKEQVRVFDFETGERRALASGSSYWGLSWSPDGEHLLFLQQEGFPYPVVAVSVGDSKQDTLAEVEWWSFARPHLSSDGRSLYYSSPPPALGALYRLPLEEPGTAEPISQLDRLISRALVSPDGKWLAFRRNTEVWVAPLGAEPIREENVRRFAPEGGDSFSFTPDGSALIYATGHRVWRRPLTGGEPEEVPVRLELRRPTPPPVLIRRVRILDFGTGGFGREAALFIEQGRIRWIGSEAGRRIPPETVTLDADGRYAIPGMFDMHVHASEANQAAFLAYGVTSVRSTADRLDWLNAALDRGEATSDAIPRYFFSGEKFDTSIWGPKYLLVHDEDEARAYVRRHKARNARFIKIYASLPWTLHRAVAEEARRQGLPVIGHGSNGVEEVVKSLILGYASVEHTLLPDRAHADVLRLLAAAGTRWDPTLSVRGGNALLFQDEPERLDDKKLRAFTPSWQVGADWEASRFRNIHAPELRRRWAMQLASIRAAHEQGVNLLAGTDNLFYGSSLHWELEYFVQAGVPPLDVLHIATQQAAEAVGADDDLGTLEVGKLADIVLLDANPLDDIKNTQTIWRVIKGGWVFDPEKLEPPDS